MKKIVILSCLIALCLLTCLIPFTSAFAKESNTNVVSKENFYKMNNKQKMEVREKHDIEANWSKAVNFIPK